MDDRLPPVTAGEFNASVSLASGIDIVSLSKCGNMYGVGVILTAADGRKVAVTMTGPRKVDLLIQALLRHKRHVWPEAP